VRRKRRHCVNEIRVRDACLRGDDGIPNGASNVVRSVADTSTNVVPSAHAGGVSRIQGIARYVAVWRPGGTQFGVSRNKLGCRRVVVARPEVIHPALAISILAKEHEGVADASGLRGDISIDVVVVAGDDPAACVG